MQKTQLYRQAYDILAKETPLYGDCGELCSAACCDCGDQEAGMYLFPGEELMYKHKPEWLKIEESSFEYAPGRHALIAICNGTCDRGLRPFACRIFPLTPYFEGNELKIIMDPRAKSICPLARTAKIGELNPEFVRRVEYISRVFSYNSEIYSFIRGLSELVEELRRFTD